jgi:hypothetical protein
LKFDGPKETIASDAEANRMLSRELPQTLGHAEEVLILAHVRRAVLTSQMAFIDFS